MAEFNFHEKLNMYPNLSTTPSNKQQFRYKQNQWFVAENIEIELMSKRLSKYIGSSNYFYKSLIILSVTTASISIASFETVVGAAVGMMSGSCCLSFWITAGIVKKLLKTTRNNKKKHNKIVTLARSK